MIKILHFHFGVSLEQIIFFLPNFQERELGIYALPPDKFLVT